jgi:hypothetical protein
MRDAGDTARGYHLPYSTSVLAAILALAFSTHAPEATPSRIGVLALQVEGELVDARRDEARARMLAALRRGDADIVDLAGATASCVDDGCRYDAARTADVRWMLAARLAVQPGDRDYDVTFTLYDVARGTTAATIEGTCELCGFEDALGVVEAKSAAVLASLERMRTSLATIMITSTTPEVTLTVDGKLVGVTPLRMQLKVGAHRIVASKAGFLPQTIDIDAIEGVAKEISLQLVVAPAPRDEKATKMITGGAVVGTLGVLAIGVGGALIAIDRRPDESDCQADHDGDCRYLVSTKPAGIAMIVSGAVVTVAGAALLGAGVRRRKAKTRVQAHARGLLVRF